MKSERIIIIDSEAKLIRLLHQLLKTAGYEVLVANRGSTVVQLVAKEQPDLIILDVVLPGDMNGFEVIHNVREFSDIPIIILSGRTSTEEILRGYNLGADDYVTKPFNGQILLAHVRAVLRRYQKTTWHTDYTEITCKDLKIDLLRRQVTLNGVEIYLAETEYNLLLELARHSNQVLLHEQLLTSVWGANYRNEIEYLRSYIHILRRKLETNPSNPTLIISKPGVGYMLVSE